MKKVYVKYGDLFPEWNRNVPYWNSLSGVNENPDGKLHYSDDEGYFDQATGVEVSPVEFQHGRGGDDDY